MDGKVIRIDKSKKAPKKKKPTEVDLNEFFAANPHIYARVDGVYKEFIKQTHEIFKGTPLEAEVMVKFIGFLRG